MINILSHCISEVIQIKTIALTFNLAASIRAFSAPLEWPRKMRPSRMVNLSSNAWRDSSYINTSKKSTRRSRLNMLPENNSESLHRESDYTYLHEGASLLVWMWQSFSVCNKYRLVICPHSSNAVFGRLSKLLLSANSNNIYLIYKNMCPPSECPKPGKLMPITRIPFSVRYGTRYLKSLWDPGEPCIVITVTGRSVPYGAVSWTGMRLR